MPSYHTHEKLAEYRRALHKDQYKAVVGAFAALWDGKGKEPQIPGSSQDGLAVLTE